MRTSVENGVTNEAIVVQWLVRTALWDGGTIIAVKRNVNILLMPTVLSCKHDGVLQNRGDSEREGTNITGRCGYKKAYHGPPSQCGRLQSVTHSSTGTWHNKGHLSHWSQVSGVSEASKVHVPCNNFERGSSDFWPLDYVLQACRWM